MAADERHEDLERAEAMSAYRVDTRRHRIVTAATMLATVTGLAAAGSIMLSAAAAPIKLVSVSNQSDTVLIEAAEPVAYSVSRPDPLTLVIDLRNVSVADARNDVERRGTVAAVRLEQATAVDGASVARVRVSLTRPAEYQAKSARNTIRVELGGAGGKSSDSSRAPLPPHPAGALSQGEEQGATLIDRIRTSKTAAATTVMLSGNGHLAPANVSEAEDAPRRLVLDFPNVSSRTANQISVDSPHVKKVRVAASSQDPVITRVVMEIANGVTYHIERGGANGRDLSVVFEAAEALSGSPVMLPAAPPAAGEVEPEPAITLEQAIRNAAALTPQDAPPPDPITALLDAPAPAAAPGRSRLVAPPEPATAPSAPAPRAVQRSAPAQRTQSASQPQKPTSSPATTQLQPVSSGDAQRKYTGHPISMDFQGADLRAVLRGFSEISGLNMVIDPDVQGTVDLILNEVPWDQALDVILRGNQLDYTVDGTIVRIARIDTLKKEQDSRQAYAKSAADAGTLEVRTFSLSYARASAAAPLVKKAALSPRGDVQIDERTNTLIITDLPARLDTAANLLSTLDRAEPQVEVEARIVQTTRDFARAVGIQWGLNGRVMPDVGNTTPLAFPNRGTLGGRLGSQGSTDPRASNLEQSSTAVNLGVPDASSAIGLALGAVNGAFNLDVALSALERTGKGRILSTPRLTTQNNIEAEVAQGIQIPIQTVANNTVTVSFKDAVLVLKVTPQITAANTVIMKITIENATPDFSRQVNGIPPIDTQRANTQIQINDGATTVIGGIFVSQEQTSNDKTPGLNRVPLLGWLFKRERVEDASRELLIFITPRILKG
jgi:type IV pilus assembly protein PilQ